MQSFKCFLVEEAVAVAGTSAGSNSSDF